jgi:hypothetical protein
VSLPLVHMHRIHFGAVGAVLGNIAKSLVPKRVRVLLDEWSVVPPELPPYLADLIRRSILPVQGFTVKVGTIEQRTSLQIAGPQEQYVGIEVGSPQLASALRSRGMVPHRQTMSLA